MYSREIFGEESLKVGESYNIDSSSMEIEYKGKIRPRLIMWGDDGFEIVADLDGLRSADYADDLFHDEKTALKELERVEVAIKNRKFKIIFQPNSEDYELKLVLTDRDSTPLQG